MTKDEIETLQRIGKKLIARKEPEAWELETAFKLLPNFLNAISLLNLEILNLKIEIDKLKDYKILALSKGKNNADLSNIV